MKNINLDGEVFSVPDDVFAAIASAGEYLSDAKECLRIAMSRLSGEDPDSRIVGSFLEVTFDAINDDLYEISVMLEADA